jgi:hypothetical protein
MEADPYSDSMLKNPIVIDNVSNNFPTALNLSSFRQIRIKIFS